MSANETLSRAQSVPAIKWEYSGIDRTARVILAINPNGFRNVESVENYIMYLATDYCIRCQKEGIRPTITGTGGWYVSFVPSEEEGYDYNVEVTLMSYVVERYLKETGVLE
jgi:hypothetical protein